jgi:hypothetical protein
MDQRDSHCPYLLASEPTAKGTGLAHTAGKEDPIELDSNVHTRSARGGVVAGYALLCMAGGRRERPLRRARFPSAACGEFGWGGTSTRTQRRCPKVAAGVRETRCRAHGQEAA